MENNDKIKAAEVRTEIAWEAYLLTKKMRRILDLYESVENEDYVRDWFSEYYPFHMSFDELIFEVDNWAEMLDKSSMKFENKKGELTCPYCGKDDVDSIDMFEQGENNYVHAYRCNKCNGTFTDIYELHYVGYADDDGHRYDENGERIKENNE